MRLKLFEVLMDCGDTELLAELYDLNDKYEKCVAFLKRMRGGDGSADAYSAALLLKEIDR